MSAPCPETSSVEALWDGRLGSAREGVMRAHVATCEQCAREAGRLETLRTALRSRPEREPSPREVARGRRLLLDAARGAESALSPARRATVPLIAATLALAAGVSFWPSRPRALEQGRTMSTSSSVPARSTGALEVQVTPAPRANWSRTTEGEREVVSLVEGKLEIAVHRNGDARRLAVRLPDGELDDEGTVFSVQVSHERTQRVSVSEGSVLLRLARQPARHVTAGETFVAPETVEAERASAPETTAAASGGDVSRPREAAAPPRSSARTETSPSDVEPCPGVPRFEDCVGAFKRGEYAAAADAFARYSSACGRHAEDATYLRMVSLARAGRPAEARELARGYLARFPEGFRRKEAERLAHGE